MDFWNTNGRALSERSNDGDVYRHIVPTLNEVLTDDPVVACSLAN